MKISKNHLKYLKKLKQKKFRLQKNLTIVEGIRTVSHLSKNGVEFQEIYLADDFQPDFKISQQPQKFDLTESEMKAVTSTKSPQKVAALVNARMRPFNQMNRILFLEDINEPGNLGTIIRTAQAFNYDGIFITKDTCDIFSPKVIRASLGCVFTIPIKVFKINELKSLDIPIITTVKKDGTSLKSYDSAICKRHILAIGSEAHGLSQTIINRSNLKMTIPMSKSVDSLNVAVAAGICMSILNKQACSE